MLLLTELLHCALAVLTVLSDTLVHGEGLVETRPLREKLAQLVVERERSADGDAEGELLCVGDTRPEGELTPLAEYVPSTTLTVLLVVGVKHVVVLTEVVESPD